MIYLRKSGFVYKGDEGVKIPPSNILQNLIEDITIEKEFTLRDYFTVVKNYDLLNLLDPFLEEYCEEALKVKNKKINEHESILVEKVFTIHGGKKESKIESYFEVCIITDDNLFLGLDFCPIKDLVNMEIRLRTVKTGSRGCSELINNFMFGEFMKAVIWELSFWGSVKKTKLKKNKMKKIMMKVLTYDKR
jgi:hypothetical protein